MEASERMPHVGDPIVYVDPKRNEHHALVTANWGSQDDPVPSVNVVFCVGDENSTDQYGRQIGRDTSVPHQSKQTAPGRYWLYVTE